MLVVLLPQERPLLLGPEVVQIVHAVCQWCVRALQLSHWWHNFEFCQGYWSDR